MNALQLGQLLREALRARDDVVGYERHDSHCLLSNRERSPFMSLLSLWYNAPWRGPGGARKGGRARLQSGTVISCLTREGNVKREFTSDGELSVAWLEAGNETKILSSFASFNMSAHVGSHTLVGRYVAIGEFAELSDESATEHQVVMVLVRMRENTASVPLHSKDPRVYHDVPGLSSGRK